MNEHIIHRNFFRLLRAGAFQEELTLEPMSAYKWQKLCLQADIQGVRSFIEDEIIRQADDDYLNIPEGLVEEMAKPAGITDAEVFSDIRPLSNRFLNKRLTKIIEAEENDYDASPASLRILGLLIYNVKQILDYGLDFEGLLQLGIFLRSTGEKVDYVKLEQWLKMLHLKRMAQLEGSILIAVFGFSQDEIPFVETLEKEAIDIVMGTLHKKKKLDPADEWYFRQRKDGFVSNNSRRLQRNLKRSLHYLRYASLETTSSFFGNLVRSMSEIEE
ncbi:MAG: hypothetical protein PUK16_03670 [Prevotellaceae bacterium]|nr:hypothetical protein [Prevotellaceae bacterium]